MKKVGLFAFYLIILAKFSLTLAQECPARLYQNEIKSYVEKNVAEFVNQHKDPLYVCKDKAGQCVPTLEFKNLYRNTYSPLDSRVNRARFENNHTKGPSLIVRLQVEHARATKHIAHLGWRENNWGGDDFIDFLRFQITSRQSASGQQCIFTLLTAGNEGCDDIEDCDGFGLVEGNSLVQTMGISPSDIFTQSLLVSKR